MPSRGTTQTSRPLASVLRAISGTGSGLSAAYGGRSSGRSAAGPATAAPQASAETARASSVCLKKMVMEVSSVLAAGVRRVCACVGCVVAHLSVQDGGVGVGRGGLQHRVRLAVDDGAVVARQVGARGA